MTAALAADGDASQEAEGEGPSAADNYRCVVDTVRPPWYRLQHYTKGYNQAFFGQFSAIFTNSELADS